MKDVKLDTLSRWIIVLFTYLTLLFYSFTNFEVRPVVLDFFLSHFSTSSDDVPRFGLTYHCDQSTVVFTSLRNSYTLVVLNHRLTYLPTRSHSTVPKSCLVNLLTLTLDDFLPSPSITLTYLTKIKMRPNQPQRTLCTFTSTTVLSTSPQTASHSSRPNFYL